MTLCSLVMRHTEHFSVCGPMPSISGLPNIAGFEEIQGDGGAKTTTPKTQPLVVPVAVTRLFLRVIPWETYFYDGPYVDTSSFSYS